MTIFDNFATRRRNHREDNDDVHCGDTYVSIDGGKTWRFSTSYIYRAKTLGLRPYKKLESCADSTHPGPPYRSGGFLSIHKYVDDLVVKGSGDIQHGNYMYRGGFVPSPQINTALGVNYTSGNLFACYEDETGPLVSFGDVDAYGATGWKRFRPGNPTADAAVFIAELKDVPRMLRGTAKFFQERWKNFKGMNSGLSARALSDHWLNTQFGWLPFVNDLRKFYKAFKLSRTLYENMRRDNGRWLKKGGTVLEDTSSEVVKTMTSTGHWPALPTALMAPGATGSYTLTDVLYKRIWFEARFRYYIPDLGSSYWNMRAHAALFGLKPNPAVIWELIPWSWLVDWCSNAGDVMANFDTNLAENLVAKYAFVMGTTEHAVQCHSRLNLWNGPVHNYWTFKYTRKARSSACPYGFGLTSESLNARQWSILAALGFSKQKGRWSTDH